MIKTAAVLLSTLLVSSSISAHTLWLVPSHYVLSKQDSWISVDASAANMTFVPDKGISLQSLKLYLPDGKVQDVTSVHQGKRKSMADVQLAGDGTYKLEMANPLRFFTSYELNGERKRLMANKQERTAQLPAGATKVETTQMRSRNFAYITVNSPTDTVVKLQGKGLEINSNVHPADVVAEESLELVFNLDGKPQAGVKGVLSASRLLSGLPARRAASRRARRCSSSFKIRARSAAGFWCQLNRSSRERRQPTQ